MPAKSKKSPSKDEAKTPAKKFVVEEKTDSTTPEEPEVKVNPEPETPEPTEVKPEESVKEPEMEVKIDSTEPVIKSEESVLKTEPEKDTLPVSSVTSFSLLDSDEKKSEVKPMEENKESLPTTTPTQSPDLNVAPPKSSQEEVNKWIENYDDKDTGEKKKGSGFFKIFLIILIVLSVLAVIAGGFYYYQKNIATPKEDGGEKTSEVTQAPTSTPEPTKAPDKSEEVDYTKLNLQILNGSGIPGEAGKVKDLLTSLKFKTVITANAANYDFEKTIVAVKEGTSDQVYKDVAAALGKVYDMDKEIETLPASSKYEVVITVGKKI